MLKQWVIEYSIKLIIRNFLKYLYFLLFIYSYILCEKYILWLIHWKRFFFKKNKLNGNQLKAEPSLHSKEKNNN